MFFESIYALSLTDWEYKHTLTKNRGESMFILPIFILKNIKKPKRNKALFLHYYYWIILIKLLIITLNVYLCFFSLL